MAATSSFLLVIFVSWDTWNGSSFSVLYMRSSAYIFQTLFCKAMIFFLCISTVSTSVSCSCTGDDGATVSGSSFSAKLFKI